MEKAANDTVAMMKGLAPSNTGTLRDSIAWTYGDAPRGSLVVATVNATQKFARRGKSKDLTITIYAGGPDAYYARWIEFGTEKMAKQPYFYVSWRANRKSAKRKINSEIRKTAKRVAAGGL